MRPPIALQVIVLILILSSVLPAASLPRVPVADIIGNPLRYRDVRVKVVGEVTKVEVDPVNPAGMIYTLQDSSGQVMRVRTLVPPDLNSRIYAVGAVTQDDSAAKPYMVELRHGFPGPPMSLLLGVGGALMALAVVLAYLAFAPRPETVRKQKQIEGQPEVERRPVITQVYRDDPVAVLIATSGPHKGEVFNIYRGSNTIGRDDNQTVQLQDDSTISRSHAKIDVTDGSVLIINQSMTNPTRVSGEEVMERELVDGDIIQIGSTRLKVTIVPTE